MKKYSKKYKAAIQKVDVTKTYPLQDAAKLLKEAAFAKFDESVDISVRLGIDPTKSNQTVRGVVSLPHGTGKKIRVLALVNPDKEKDAKDAGADYVGLDEYVNKISQGWTDVDVVVTTPDVMPKIARLGKVLGPRGLMPNPKAGTVSSDVAKAIKDVKAGKIEVKTEKTGIVHTSIGKVSFSPEQIYENSLELIHALQKMKPTASKGVYFKNISISSTMGPGITIDKKTIPGIA